MRSRFARRTLILSWIFILGAGLLVLRLYFVQIVHGSEYERDAIGQYKEASPDTENRGDIFFRKKDGGLVAAAVMQAGWRIAIQPKNMVGEDTVYEKLNAILPVDKEKFFASAGKKDDPYEEIAFRVSDADASAVRALKIPGVILVQDKWRMYPGATLAAHAIGFVGFQGNKKVGVYGLERYYEDLLAHAGRGLYVNPFAEIFTSMESLLARDPRTKEGDVITSIEPSVEQNLESVLKDIQKMYDPKLVGGIVMDPRTGEIIAMAVRPDFDPNTYNTVTDPSVFGNPLVESLYEMGSIMKPLTLAAAIDAGVITPETTYNDKGFIIKSGKKISNFDGKARGVVSMQEVLNQSLNTGASFVEEQMGHETFAKYVRAYGLGEETGVDLPGEIAGNIRAIDGGVDVDYASASFGQGIAMTPIEMIRALGALANDGLLPEPHVAVAVRYESGVVRNVTQPPQKQVLKPETAGTMAAMLTEVYDKALLNGALKQEHYSIAAKTGTAQIGIPGGGGYYADRYLHAFFGFFPAHDPRFIVFLYAVEPQKEIYAARTLSRPFLSIAKFLINYYNIPPDR
jgi:stage V sporulation protein D (sporulation-specific penicillin-binding protein)